MFTKSFFKLFPPPLFIDTPYAGLDISDNSIHAIEFSKSSKGLNIQKIGMRKLETGIIDSGLIKDEQKLINILNSLIDEIKIHTVKVSLPEERMYLFKIEIPDMDESKIKQYIEFRLEENIPLSPKDVYFFFQLFNNRNSNNKRVASVSVAPRDLVDSYLKVLKTVGLEIISFEIQPKAIAKSVVSTLSNETQIIVYNNINKAGIYIVSCGIVCFTSTINIDNNSNADIIKNELKKVYSYWNEYGEGRIISRIILTGNNSIKDSEIHNISPDSKIPVEIGHIWQNAFNNDNYIPSISFDDSLEYVVAIGLALP